MTQPVILRSGLIADKTNPPFEPCAAASSSEKIVIVSSNAEGGGLYVSHNGGTSFPEFWRAKEMFGGPWLRLFDQVVLWSPQIERFVTAGCLRTEDDVDLGMRIALLQGFKELEAPSAFFDYTPDMFGISDEGAWFDRPEIALSDKHLLLTATAVDPDRNRLGCVMARISWDALLAAEGAGAPWFVGFDYHVAEEDLFPAHDCTGTAYFADATGWEIIVYSWEADSSDIWKRTCSVAPYLPLSGSAGVDDGHPWMSKAGQGVVAGTYTGTWFGGESMVFAYSAMSSKHSLLKGVATAHPFIYLVALTDFPLEEGGTMLDVTGARVIWHPDFAWSMPALAALDGKLAMACAWGKDKPNWALGYLDLPLNSNSQFHGWTMGKSTAVIDRWGDYISVRSLRERKTDALFVSVGYVADADDQGDYENSDARVVFIGD